VSNRDGPEGRRCYRKNTEGRRGSKYTTYIYNIVYLLYETHQILFEEGKEGIMEIQWRKRTCSKYIVLMYGIITI
jgi:hypothetical protein